MYGHSRHKLLTLFLLSAAFHFPTGAQDTVRMTLDSCLRYAYGHNLTVLTAELNGESARNTLSGAKMRFLPSVNASASQGLGWSDQTTRSGNYGINASLPLFSGLGTVANLKQARAGLEQSDLQAQQTRNNVGVRILQQYLTLLMNREKLAYQQEVLQTSIQQEREGEVRLRVGKILESDYRLLQASRISAESEVQNTRLTIEQNRADLATLIGYEEGGVLEAVAPLDSLNAEGREVMAYGTLLTRARESMPDWQLGDLEVEMAQLNVDIARSNFLPSLSLNAGASYSDGTVLSDNPVTHLQGGLNSSLTLGLSIPIFNAGSSLTSYRQSKIALRQAELQRREGVLDLESQLQELHTSTCQALNRFRASEALAHAYKASYDVYTIKYGQGAVTTVELLQQQDRYLSALNDWLQNKYSYLLAEKQLDIYTGKEITL